MHNKPVTAVTLTDNVALVVIDHLQNDVSLISNIFESIARQKVNISMFSQTPPHDGHIAISFAISTDDMLKALSILNKYKAVIPGLRIEVDAYNTKLCVYGEGIKSTPGITAKLYTLFAEKNISSKLVTTSEEYISYLIYDKDAECAVEAVKNEFSI